MMRVVILFLLLALSACGTSVEPVTEPEPIDVVAVEDKEPPKNKTVVTKLDNKTINPLTGLIINSTDAEKRPYAVMINNIPKALPQSGISKADIFYEALAEGDISRILAIFQEYDVEKIGPVRSARHYFIDFAYDHDAIYVHHGRSPQANESIINNRVENLDGMELEGTAFWRDQERIKMGGMYEHSSYTNSQNLLEAAEKKGYRIDNGGSRLFDFYNTDAELSEPFDEVVRVEFAPLQIAEFTYDSATMLYARSQNSGPQIDEMNDEQIKVKNILIQYANVYVIPGDPEGRRNIETVSAGEGMLYTNGTMQTVRWSKQSTKSPTRWTDLDGNKLKLNKGKTWICVI